MKLRAWKGPLPPKRSTPPAVLADFIDAALRTSVVREAEDSIAETRSAAALFTEPAVVPMAPAERTSIATASQPHFKLTDAGSGASVGGPHARWAWFGRAVMAVQRVPRRAAYVDHMRSRSIDQVSYRTKKHLRRRRSPSSRLRQHLHVTTFIHAITKTCAASILRASHRLGVLRV
jgi:hypothetical protein